LLREVSGTIALDDVRAAPQIRAETLLGSTVAAAAVTAAGPGISGGTFVGDLYLDSGEFLGVVRGEVRQEINEHDRNIKRKITSGTELAR
jgi:hypothetical protein